MLDDFLLKKLSEMENAGLLRTLNTIQSNPAVRIEVNGRKFINFSSNNYLDLAGNKEINKAVADAIEKYGFAGTSSRLVCGNLSIHEELEAGLAVFKNKQASLVLPSGYQTNVGIISALMANEKNSCIIMDKLNHASLWDGVKLSGSRIFVYEHCDMNSLEKTLKRAHKYEIKLTITEAVFSMDGDFAPLKDFTELCRKYGAVSMVDEAHSTGVFGKEGKGLAEVFGVSNKIDITVGTLSKAFAAQGGFVCGSLKLINFLINKSRAFIYTTAISPAVCAAALKSLEILKGSATERAFLLKTAEYLKKKLNKLGFNTSNTQSQIIPVITGSVENTERISLYLREKGIYIPAIKPPTVPKEQSRIRISLTAGHTTRDIEKLTDSISEIV
ncbi:8-amino-7-oxononanoate synthase [Candidatus Endomicrobiellum trichonymphae]|uniref:8-amino-7-ketopelargonate synthase n=1 Tax=Endomicrobium trichonymphae TaxID=1408204 RepID=B1H0L2_ENDTX|nr:8-amino-7-oxononanoate synthase [Candidatus Endomicrobium trichonymphae]BAG14044.1 8-amino-7-oxononanoate synthase [Candidatus Endomicrobium trichonymphae]